MIQGDPDKVLEGLARDFCHKAREHGADSVTVLITRVSHEGTHRVVRGEGNLYARRAVAEEWLRCQDESDRVLIRRREEE